MTQPTETRPGERNLLVSLRYCGREYHGFQVQQNAQTVAQVFQEALWKILGQKVDIKGCSRTDSGVHANCFAVSFRTQSRIPCEGLVKALNCALPWDIAALGCREVPQDFHARYSSRGKRYLYRIHNHPVKDPFRWGMVWEYRYAMDLEKLNRACRDFVGRHDFTAFCAAGSSVEDRVRTIYGCGLLRQREDVVFWVEGDGFLYNMVRIMVGTLIDISAGSLPPGCIPDILQSRDRSRAGQTAPAAGLYLDQVFYDLEGWPSGPSADFAATFGAAVL